MRLTKQSATEDSIQIYLREIGQIPLLTHEQEITLARSIASSAKLEGLRSKLAETLGVEPSQSAWAEAADCDVQTLTRTLSIGRRAKDRMITANLRLVVSIAKKYQNRGLDLMDLVQEGSIGLVRAAEKFDHKRGYKFSTYAHWWIRQAMTRGISQQSRNIRLPVHLYESINKYRKTVRGLAAELRRNPQKEEIAAQMEVSVDQIDKIREYSQNTVSGNNRIGTDQDAELFDFIPATDIPSPDEEVYDRQLSDRIGEVLSYLPDRQQQLLVMRYGLDGAKPKTLNECGEVLGYSRERARQILARANRSIRVGQRKNLLAGFL